MELLQGSFWEVLIALSVVPFFFSVTKAKTWEDLKVAGKNLVVFMIALILYSIFG